MKTPNLSTVIEACLRHGHRLIEDAVFLAELGRHPTACSLAILAQEEFAKTFLLVLVQERAVPWTSEVRRALNDHKCKHLIAVLMEWLSPSYDEELERANAFGRGQDPSGIPHDVAVALNILRHEKIEQFKRGWADADPEWNDYARRIAKGLHDRLKQRGFYVNVATSGFLASVPTQITEAMATEQLSLAKRYGEFAGYARANCVLSIGEYRMIKEVLTAIFADLTQKESGA